MIALGLKKYLINPALGLLASILFFLLVAGTGNLMYSLIIASVFSLGADMFLRLYIKTAICGLIYVLNFCALFTTFILYLILKNTANSDFFYLVFYEIIFIMALVITRFLKTYLSLYLGKNKGIIQKTFLGEFFEVAKLAQYSLTLHLFLLLLYKYSAIPEIKDSFLEILFYFLLPSLLLVLIIVFEEVKTKNIVKKLHQEEWLPIVKGSGEVIGKIAKSVSLKMKNRFLHPVIRVALIHNGEIYLQERPTGDVLDPSSYDHPFEKYMIFNHEINIAVRNSISRALNMQELPFRFLLKYEYNNKNTKRLIFLFASHIETEEQMQSLSLLKGKFWSLKQIEESFNDDKVFSECFQLEYEYLKNMVIQPQLGVS